jgi:hypothetical protein
LRQLIGSCPRQLMLHELWIGAERNASIKHRLVARSTLVASHLIRHLARAPFIRALSSRVAQRQDISRPRNVCAHQRPRRTRIYSCRCATRRPASMHRTALPIDSTFERCIPSAAATAFTHLQRANSIISAF